MGGSTAAYLSLGQIHSGAESLAYTERGITLIQSLLQDQQKSEQERQELAISLSSAYCSMAELYMTDLCFEHDAEQKCEEYARLACEADPGNPEAYQCLASLRLTQQRIDDGREMLQKSLSLWMPLEPESSMDAEMEVERRPMPVYSSRLTLAKMLLEVKAYEWCLMVLKTIQQENDENMELWYLYAMAYWLLGSDTLLAQHYCEENESSVEQQEQKLQEIIDGALKGEVELEDEVKVFWAESLGCLEEAKKLSETIGSEGIEQHQMDEMVDIYATLDSLFATILDDPTR